MSDVSESLIFGQKTSDLLGNQMSEFPALIKTDFFPGYALKDATLKNKIVELWYLNNALNSATCLVCNQSGLIF